jgi:hypothetical protein
MSWRCSLSDWWVTAADRGKIFSELARWSKRMEKRGLLWRFGKISFRIRRMRANGHSALAWQRGVRMQNLGRMKFLLVVLLGVP